jgi:hypothetical protein
LRKAQRVIAEAQLAHQVVAVDLLAVLVSRFEQFAWILQCNDVPEGVLTRAIKQKSTPNGMAIVA